MTTLHAAATNAADFLKTLLDAEPDAAVDALTNNGEGVEDALRTALKAEPGEYSYEHLEAAACMWEHVLRELRRHREKGNMWEEFREAYGMAELRARVIRHAPQLETAYQEAVANGYDKDFDWEYVPKYMESHIVALLT